MIDVTYDLVPRRIAGRDGTSRERCFLWRFEHRDGHLVRRTVIDYETGEIIDDAWHDNEGRVRTYSAPKDVPARRSDSPYRLDARGVEAVVASSSGADDGMVEHRRDDRPLPRQREEWPRLS